MSDDNRRGGIRTCALALGIAAATMGCGKIAVPAWLNLDPSLPSTIGVDFLGQSVDVPLSGGLHGVVVLDTARLLAPGGLLTFIQADDVLLAGGSVNVQGFETGTLCLRGNPADPTTGTAVINPLGKSSANLHLAGLLRGKLVDRLLGAGRETPVAANAMAIPLRIDLLRLLTLNFNGAVRADAIAMGQLAAALPLVGGAPFALHGSFSSSSSPPSGPLVTECRASAPQ